MSFANMPSNFDAINRREGASTNTPTNYAEELGPEFHETDAQRDENIHELARTYTQQSSIYRAQSRSSATAPVGAVGSDGKGLDPFNPEEGSSLDPYSPNFVAMDWAKAMLQLHKNDPNAAPGRTAGVAFKNLSAFGYGTDTSYQATVGNTFLKAFGALKGLIGGTKRKIQILEGLDGILNSGEMLVVLGPPGSGCSTFLKTLAQETDGFVVEGDMNYQGITPKQMRTNFKGEAIYTAETDVHFPNMTVGQTLQFAAEARAPRTPPGGASRQQFASMMSSVMMASYGIGHTKDTKVGNDFIRGVSGGERKRVSIAEASLSAAPLQLWDNSTRGLDAANAVEFCKTLRMSTDLRGGCCAVAIYQAPGAAFAFFDKAIVLYEGHAIFFGPTNLAKQYFIDLGYHCEPQETTPDFLTSMTSKQERRPREGWEDRVPRTPEEFAAAWKNSDIYKSLATELGTYDSKFPVGGEMLQKFQASMNAQKAKGSRESSPYTLSYGGQVGLCLRRGFLRLKTDPEVTLSQLLGNMVMGLLVASVFYNLPNTTESFYRRGSLLFFSILLNAFGAALEILTLYAQRPIVDKQARYAFYHPSAEAFASMATDLPYKILNNISFNLIIYFMTNLNRAPGPFFFFCFVTFFLTLAMSGFFRLFASLSRTLSQALVPAALFILAMVLYTGFAIPTRYMLGWISWFRWLNPIQYAFEALMVNEFDSRNYPCSVAIPQGPGYPDVNSNGVICSTVGAVAGQNFVSGTAFLNESYGYYAQNKWRDAGIVIVFVIGLTSAYLFASEFITGQKSKGEVLVFPRTRVPKDRKRAGASDVEAGDVTRRSSETKADEAVIQKQTAIFHWQDVCFTVPVKGGERMLLDHIDGWVKPGTLTALMGVSGAGKTTLLDVLASRVTTGVISGDMLVDGNNRDDSFQRKTGYVTQSDLHLQTATVREALTFSALLRQPRHITRKEKLAYVDEILKLLDMDAYGDAVIGVPGEGLNVEQRKRLTIGVELVAKPELLLFLDEPTSGLDSQTSFAILELLEKLKNHGQAILCTIHQPSALLFSRFDRLLFLAKGGRTIYFGPVGEQSKILRSYFEANGSAKFPDEANPAEFMLEVIGAAPGTHSDIDWHETWKSSAEYEDVQRELAGLRSNPKAVEARANDKFAYAQFAAPLGSQFREVTLRVFQQYWRTPSYIYSKFAIVIILPAFVGFSFFNSKTSLQGLQNQLFSVFLLYISFSQLTQQIMPQFVLQRTMYEARERPARTYSWVSFMTSNILVELAWNSLAALPMFFCWYYPIGLYNNAIPTNTVAERGGLTFLLVWMFLLFTSSFAHMAIAAADSAETAGNIANLIFSLSLIFCGVLSPASSLPGFWIFMIRVSPFTYLTEGILTTAVGRTQVICDPQEFLTFQSQGGQTCGDYMKSYISGAGGYLSNPTATSDCKFCSIQSTDVFLASFDYNYANRFRDFGLMWVYVVFNLGAAYLLYYLVRVPKKPKAKSGSSKKDASTASVSDEKKVKSVEGKGQ